MKKRFKTQGSKVKINSFKLYAFYCLLITILILSGCVTTTDFETVKGDTNQSRKEIFELKKDINDLKLKTANVIKEEDFRAFGENQGDLQSRVSDVEKTVQMLTGKFDENKYSTEKALKDSASEMTLLKAQMTSIEDQIKEIKTRLKTLDSQPGEAKKKPEETKKEASQYPSKPIEARDKISLYEEAYDFFKDKKYKEAREKFEAFMKEFPQDELADNAQFWIAETYYGEKDYETAILAYEAVLKKYPKSEKAQGSLLKQGFSFIEIGDKKTGKTILEKLVEIYPESREAELAKKKIEEIDKGISKKKK
jgi:tol-pal system protein YbgF